MQLRDKTLNDLETKINQVEDCQFTAVGKK